MLQRLQRYVQQSFRSRTRPSSWCLLYRPGPQPANRFVSFPRWIRCHFLSCPFGMTRLETPNEFQPWRIFQKRWVLNGEELHCSNFWDWWIVVFVRCIETWLFFRKKEPFNHWHSVMAWKSRKFRGFQPPLLVWLLVGECTFYPVI